MDLASWGIVGIVAAMAAVNVPWSSVAGWFLGLFRQSAKVADVKVTDDKAVINAPPAGSVEWANLLASETAGASDADKLSWILGGQTVLNAMRLHRDRKVEAAK